MISFSKSFQLVLINENVCLVLILVLYKEASHHTIIKHARTITYNYTLLYFILRYHKYICHVLYIFSKIPTTRVTRVPDNPDNQIFQVYTISVKINLCKITINAHIIPYYFIFMWYCDSLIFDIVWLIIYYLLNNILNTIVSLFYSTSEWELFFANDSLLIM
jgi:hypothetical protein